MLISWIQKTTLLDFPGKVSCIIFTAGCNLRCQYCHNSEFVLPEKISKITDFIPEEVFFNFLQSKIWVLDGVVICWGEPTVQKDLALFCRRIKQMWFLVKLDTNGQNPEVLELLLQEKLLDYIAMDIKCDYKNGEELLWVSYDKTKYFQTIEIIKNSGIDYEFRTTLIKNYHTLDNFHSLIEQISGAKKYFLQNFKWGNTLQKDFAGASFSSHELLELKALANKYVEKCEIRI